MEVTIGLEECFELCAFLQQTRDLIAKARQNELREMDIVMEHLAVLAIVKAIDGPAIPAEISRRLLREPQTVTALLKQMEKRDLVRKVKDLEKKNMVRVVLTEKGEETVRLSQNCSEAMLRIISTLSEEERSSLRNCLGKLRDEAFRTLGKKPRPWHPLHISRE